MRGLWRYSMTSVLVAALVASGAGGCGGTELASTPRPDASVEDSGDAGSVVVAAGDDASDGASPPPPSLDATPGRPPWIETSCPGPLPMSQVAALKAAASNPAGLAWLYPYDGTVFPGGILPPILQWKQSGTPDALLVHLHSKLLDITACYAGSNTLQLKIEEKSWATAYAQNGGKTDPLTIELRTLSADVASGPITETVFFARGTLPGVVYYDTYGSQLVPDPSARNGAVIRIQNSGATALLSTSTGSAPNGPCVSCHAVSSSGSIVAAQQERLPGAAPLDGKGSMTFDLRMTPAPNPASPVASTLADDWGLSAVYPNGRWLLTSGEPADSTGSAVVPSAANDNVGMVGPKPAALYDTATGNAVPFTGPIPAYPMMPMFSPDGRQVAFANGDADAGAHTLTAMDFDAGSQAFANARGVFHDDARFPGWPAFTPDGQQIVFALGNTGSGASEDPNVAGSFASSELYIAPAAGGAAHRLDAASGYRAGVLYLPNGSQDEGLDFYPSVAPVASGGYFWVFFTSRRAFGNLNDLGPGDVGSKAIWVSAIDIGAAAGVDPSHPAFYLPGQELGSGNFRPTAVLAPCKDDVTSCEIGYECCGGKCTSGKCNGVLSVCSGEGEYCDPTTLCCNATDRCIGGYCASVTP
jgi:hypothetical protein